LKTKILLISLLLLLLFSVQSVAAVSDDDGNLTSESIDLSICDNTDDVSSDELSNNQGDVLSASNELDVLSADEVPYSTLYDEISPGGNVELQHDYYICSGGESTITISGDNRIIDGRGAVIDMAGSTIRAFDVSGSGITIKNLTIKNANYNGDGGAIYFSSNSGTVENCNFTNNSASDCGGAVFFLYEGTVTNCNFTNNSASSDGGAILMGSGTVENCNFTNNTAAGGGAIYMSSGSVENCNFTNNTATNDDGGAVFFVWDGTVTNCNFTNNTASRDGGAIDFEGTGTVTNCNFTGNTATYGGGGAVYFKDSGTVSNCNFTGNNATGTDSRGGAVYFENSGDVRNCNFTGNTAGGNGGAVYFKDSGTVSNCNFTNNSARYGGAIEFDGTGTVTNCNFTDNKATGSNSWGGAIYMYSGSVENCNFTNNSASDWGGAIHMYSGNVENCNFTNNTATNGYGGAIVFGYSDNPSTVTNCNFTGNTATTGSAIYFYSTSAQKSVSNSIFLNNRANAKDLQVTKNENNITITFTGNNNILNAIYSRNDAKVSFSNVTYWGANGIVNTDTHPPSISNNAAGQNITIKGVVNGNIINTTKVTDKNGKIVLDAGDYLIIVSHKGDSYYTEVAERLFTNMTFNVNVTNQTSNNRTVNITAKSNIPNEVLKGKLLFILPNSTQINANYTVNGTWWAVHEFDDAGDYVINASYIGLDGVIINNATISIRYDASVDVNNKTLDLLVGDTFTIVANTTPKGLNVTYVPDDSGVYDVDKSGVVTALKNGTGSVLVKIGGDGVYAENSTIVTVTVTKVPTEIKVTNATLDLKVNVEIDTGATLNPPEAGDLTYTVSNSSVVKVEGGKIKALAAGKAVVTVSFAGDDKYAAAENKTITVTVTLNDASVSVNNATLNLLVGENFTIEATTDPKDLKVTYVPDDSGVYEVNNNGLVKALKEGTGSITVKIGGDGVYAENSTTVDIHVKHGLNITATADSITVGENANIIVTGLENATGNVTVTIDNYTYYGSILNSTATVIIPGLKNNITITVKYDGDDNYYATFTTIDIIVYRNNLNITATADQITVGDNATVKVTGLEDATGEIKVVIDGNEWIGEISKGTAEVIITGLKESVTAEVLYPGDEKYNNASTTVDIIVKKDLNLTGFVFGMGNTITIIVMGFENATGNATITVNANNYTTSIKNSRAIVSMPKMSENTTAYIYYPGDDKYNNASTTVDIHAKKALNITATADPITVGDNATVIVTGLENATGNVSVTIDDNTYYGSIINGTAAVIIPGLKNNVTGTVNYAGDDAYYATFTSIDIVVYRKNLKITATAVPITVGDNATVKVTGLKDATGEVTVVIDGNEWIGEISNGTAEVIISGLNETVTAEVLYPGDVKYNDASATVDIVVNPVPDPDKKNLTISASADPITVGENATVKVTGLENATGNVFVIVNGKIYAVPIKNGEATLTVSGLTENVTAIVNYIGDATYNPAVTIVNITVYSINIDAPNVVKYFSGPERFVVNVTNSKGTPLSNKTVFITINGRTYNRTTDENGIASLGLNLHSGIYNVVSAVDNQTVISLVTILPTVNGTDVVKMYRNGTQYYATFRDSEGKYLADGTTVKFNINGVMYERKVSGDKGLAKLNINLPSGEYIITAINPKTGENAANNIAVLPTIVENRDIIKYYKNATQYTVKVLGADGNPVGAGKTVTFNINGVMYQRQTNESGIAQLNINLPPGDYIITASYEGYNVANNITVLPVLSASNLKMKYMDGSQFKAKLVDGKGNPYTNRYVTFNVNGIFYNRLTGDDGVAKLNIRLPAGEYIITSSYNGCNIANKITIGVK
jgi:predicted outer membrane repeat protein